MNHSQITEGRKGKENKELGTGRICCYVSQVTYRGHLFFGQEQQVGIIEQAFNKRIFELLDGTAGKITIHEEYAYRPAAAIGFLKSNIFLHGLEHGQRLGPSQDQVGTKCYSWMVMLDMKLLS